MHTNPYPPKTKSEDGKAEVPNQRYQDWQDGYTTGLLDGARFLFYDMPRSLGIKIPLLDDFFGKLK